MGDRALVIFKDTTEVSPVCYLHWNGSDVPALLESHKELMTGREGDVGYATARFIGLAHEGMPGNLSLGVWNAPDDLQEAVIKDDSAFLSAYSHGDAGVIIVDVVDYGSKAYGGYLADRAAA